MSDTGLKNNLLLTCLYKQVELEQLQLQIDEALSQSKLGSIEYFSLSFSIPKVDTLAVLEQNKGKDHFEYYWEKPSENIAISAAGEVARIKATGPQRFRTASSQGKSLIQKIFHFSSLEHSNAAPHLFGGFSFHEHNVSKHWRTFGAASFTLPQWSIIVDGELTLLTITLELVGLNNRDEVLRKLTEHLAELDDVCDAHSYSKKVEGDTEFKFEVPTQVSEDFKAWKNAVEKATLQIEKGVYDKIVLARELRIPLSSPIVDTHILNRLRHQYPDCYSFLIKQNNEASFIGCTPERLASFRSDFILTEGLAGSTPRGKTASEDARLESELLNSDKDLNEHQIVLQAIQDNLSQYAETLMIPDKPGIKKLSNVQHLYTPVRAQISEGVSKTEVLKNLHPTPAVGGFPRDKAVPFISKFEHFDRGWYAAPIGWINAHGNGEFAVGIRSGLIKNDEVRFYAGCGIVEGSQPEKEWEETNLKFIPMLSALAYATK